jgi:hypothetical protein
VIKLYVPVGGESSTDDIEQGTLAYSRLMSILNKKITKQIAVQYGLNISDIKIDDLFLTKYDAALPPKHMLGPHRYASTPFFH